MSDSRNGTNASASFDDAKLSKEGMRLLLSNDWKGAEELFGQYKNESILMSAGSSFVTFLQALLTFEDDQKDDAFKALHETEEMCKADHPKWHRKSSRKKRTPESNKEDRIRREIIITDCLLYQAGLIVIQQDIKSFVRGGWYIRHAWKRYRKLYHEVKAIYETRTMGIKREMSVTKELAAMESNVDVIKDEEITTFCYEGESFPADVEVPPEESEPDFSDMRSDLGEMPAEALCRLFGAVSFGYGIFRLFMSLIPPKIMWWIHFLGFEGNQAEGLRCLEYASQSEDMKAPLATLTLVWYHTTIRPFFALDGANLGAGVDAAAKILEHAEKEYPDSALFLYFKSRIYRLQCNSEASLETCRRALAMSDKQRETQHICLYEIGRLAMTMSQYQEAYECFIKLKIDSRWSTCFYTYLAGLCTGSLGNMDEAMSLMAEVPKLVKMKNNQLELFVSRRAQQACRMKANSEQLAILAMEVLYIWTLIPGCAENDLKQMLTYCHSGKIGSLNHLKCLIEGAIYTELKKLDEAEQCFLESLSCFESNSVPREDLHVAAFARFELGMLKAQEAHDMSDLPEAKKHFLHIKNHYKGYDFENRLSVKVSAALKRISDAEKAADDSPGGANKACSIQ